MSGELQLASLESRVRGIQETLVPMAQALGFVVSKVNAIDSQVQVVERKQIETQHELDAFHRRFLEFAQDVERRSELQLAETRIIKVRQELAQRFGHYAEVRRRVLGFLQATDIGVVRHETLRTSAEELMLAAPRYWLAPTLIALMAWVVDYREIAEKGVAEALRRDGSKVALFFLLISRRAERWESIDRWLVQYLNQIDPRAVEREVVVLLDCIARGILGAPARSRLLLATRSWTRQLAAAPDQLADQHKRWLEVLAADRGSVATDEFPRLAAASPDWSRLESSLANVRRNPRVAERFRRVLFATDSTTTSAIETLDALLESLASRFDDEELPLRKEERLLELIVEENGFRARAQERMQVEYPALSERVSFLDRLTGILMHPNQADSSQDAQRFALAVSRDWILNAHRSLVRRDTEEKPTSFSLSIAGWSATAEGRTDDGALARSLEQYFTDKAGQELAAIKLPTWGILGPIVGAFLAVTTYSGGAGASASLLSCLLALAVLLLAKRSQHKQRSAHAKAIRQALEQARAALEACLRDLSVYRSRWDQAHGTAREVEDILQMVTSKLESRDPDATLRSAPPEASAPASSAPGAESDFIGSRLAEVLPTWSLDPPEKASSSGGS